VKPCPELYILRHGETVWNREGRMQGALDSPLTDLGQAQSRAMGQLLAGFDLTGHRLYCSPLGRARATAELAFSRAPTLDPRLREIEVGQWTGLTRPEILARWPGMTEDEDMLDFYARAPGGEDFDALWNRLTAFLADLTGPAVIVTHGVTSRFLRTAALGLSLADLNVVPGGQGVVFRLRDGGHEVLTPNGLQPAAEQGKAGL
jgi:glucosyl-3-phosphoglycerate phosphatase